MVIMQPRVVLQLLLGISPNPLVLTETTAKGRKLGTTEITAAKMARRELFRLLHYLKWQWGDFASCKDLDTCSSIAGLH